MSTKDAIRSTGDNVRVALGKAQIQREAMRIRITELFAKLILQLSAKVSDAELLNGHDTHLYLTFSLCPCFCVHLQGYPGMSGDQFFVAGRVMNKEKMRAARLQGVSLGNEHQAVLFRFTGLWPSTQIAWKTAVTELVRAIDDALRGVGQDDGDGE